MWRAVWIVFGLLLVACGDTSAAGDGVTLTPIVGAGSPTSETVAVGRVAIIAIKGTKPGGQASVTISAPPHTACTIQYTMPDGKVGRAPGLNNKTTDAAGRATWTWYVGTTSPSGIGTIAVDCGGVQASERILIGVRE